MAESWTCPHCDRDQISSAQNTDNRTNTLTVKDCADGLVGLHFRARVCANTACRKLSLSLFYVKLKYNAHGPDQIQSVVNEWQLLPPSSAKSLPNYIPVAIREDYYEACAILRLSPKAAATLARRCVQGMIRDFCGIAKNRLIDEIAELTKRVNDGRAPRDVQADTLDAIDHVRNIGNIGAHMEKDIDVIVDVDPGEAEKLVELIELLLDEWYVARHKRAERLQAIGPIAEKKQEQRKIAGPKKEPEPPPGD